MRTPTVVSEARSFSKWIRNLPQDNGVTLYCKRLGFKKLLVHSEPSVNHFYLPGMWQQAHGMLQKYHIPDVKKAAAWWRCLWEGEIVDRWLNDTIPYPIVCVAKAAVWSALPEFYLAAEKSSFRIIDDQEYMMLVGPDLAYEMAAEQAEGVGISIRRIKRTN